ncbi:MAG: peptidoglycan-binding protein [Kiloniellaceae bacterium]
MVRFGSVAFASALVLAACGTTPEDRTVSGAGIGAAGGAVLGAITGLTVVEGAALGAVAGALTGVLTDENKLNLGDPFWRRTGSESRAQAPQKLTATPASYSVAPDRDLIARIQTGLIEAGYDPGPVDGLMGPKTASAIRKYQNEHALLTDGRPSVELAQHIQTQGQ